MYNIQNVDILKIVCKPEGTQSTTQGPAPKEEKLEELNAPMQMSSSRYRLIMTAKWCLTSQEEARECLLGEGETRRQVLPWLPWWQCPPASPVQQAVMRDDGKQTMDVMVAVVYEIVSVDLMPSCSLGR